MTVQELIDKGKRQGFVTNEEITHLFNDIDQHLDEIDGLCYLLLDAGVEIVAAAQAALLAESPEAETDWIPVAPRAPSATSDEAFSRFVAAVWQRPLLSEETEESDAKPEKAKPILWALDPEGNFNPDICITCPEHAIALDPSGASLINPGQCAYRSSIEPWIHTGGLDDDLPVPPCLAGLVGSGSGSSLGEVDYTLLTLSRCDAVQTENYVERRRAIERALGTLTARERSVIQLRFGLDDRDERTLEEVGQLFGLTRERIRQVQQRALRRLRHPSRSGRLRKYWSAA